MNKLFILLLLVSSVAAIAQKKSPSPDTRLASIDAKLQSLLTNWKVAG